MEESKIFKESLSEVISLRTKTQYPTKADITSETELRLTDEKKVPFHDPAQILGSNEEGTIRPNIVATIGANIIRDNQNEDLEEQRTQTNTTSKPSQDLIPPTRLNDMGRIEVIVSSYNDKV